MYKHPNLLIILASKYITSLKIVNYFFFFLFVNVLMFLQMETFTFLSFCIPIFGFSQKQILRQGLKCNQFVWKMIPRNTSREGDREGNTANKGAIIKTCDHLQLVQNSSFRATSPAGPGSSSILYTNGHQSLVEGCWW